MRYSFYAAALVLSLLVHGLLLFGGGWFVDRLPAATPAQLDLSSVELSLSDEPVETAAPSVVPSPVPLPDAPPPPPILPEFVPLTQTESDVRVPDETPVEIAPPDVEAPPPEEKRADVPPPAPAVAPAPAPRQARIDAPPSPRRTIKPAYPEGARRRGEEGNVTLELSVNAAGGVDEVAVLVSSGFAELDAAAVKAARAARFTPAKSGGRAVSARAHLTLEFRLKN